MELTSPRVSSAWQIKKGIVDIGKVEYVVILWQVCVCEEVAMVMFLERAYIKQAKVPGLGECRVVCEARENRSMD
jgi:hypothetical protein